MNNCLVSLCSNTNIGCRKCSKVACGILRWCPTTPTAESQSMLRFHTERASCLTLALKSVLTFDISSPTDSFQHQIYLHAYPYFLVKTSQKLTKIRPDLAPVQPVKYIMRCSCRRWSLVELYSTLQNYLEICYRQSATTPV